MFDSTTTQASPRIGYYSQEGEVHDVRLETVGAIPAWLQGALLRNGPALFEAGERTVRHWFDGQAMLHRFSVSEGSVTYGNRFLRTKAYAAAQDGTLSYSEFATDPCRSIFKRAMTVFDPGVTDNASVAITALGRRHYAMTEAPMAVEFDPQTLETLGYGPKLPGLMATAHPHHDTARGELINIASQYGPRNAYRVFAQGEDGRTRNLFSERVSRPGYVHSFAMTPRYVAHTEFPFVVNPIEIPLKGRPFIENFRWRPEDGTRIIVWDRTSGKRVGEFQTEAGFAFHHVGAWEEDGKLVMEYVDHSNPSVIDALYLNKLRTGSRTIDAGRLAPRLRRVTIDPARAEVDSELRSEQPIEMPRIDERRYLQRYRTIYGIGASGASDYDTADTIVKLDNESGEAELWHEPGCYPGEPIFVARPGGQDEDDGLVLSVVLDANAEDSYLLILDAADLQEVARARAPHLIPHGLHGAFYAEG
jgi:carotenoid cleavage dioxygenase-like enzyme